MEKKNTRNKTRDMIMSALGAVMIAACSWISIPTMIPFTMQTFAIFLILSMLGGKRGLLSIIVYIAIGSVGAPVFAGFSSGVGVLIGTTGGYLVGFIFIGLIYWLTIHFLGRKLWVEAVALVVGLFVCYAFGTAWFMVVYAGESGPIGIATALSWCVLPFIFPNLVQLVLALVISRRVAKFQIAEDMRFI